MSIHPDRKGEQCKSGKINLIVGSQGEREMRVKLEYLM